jgi:hypothetical protein
MLGSVQSSGAYHVAADSTTAAVFQFRASALALGSFAWPQSEMLGKPPGQCARSPREQLAWAGALPLAGGLDSCSSLCGI